MDETSKAILTVSGVLFGFFFAGFWWIINRELRFKPEDRHFKPSTGVLIIGMALLAVFGIIVPLRQAAGTNPMVTTSYRGIALAMIAVFGYMLIEMGHQHVIQMPKNTTFTERLFFIATMLLLIGLVVKWWLLPHLM